MDFWTVLKACARRWYVFLPILGAALLIGNVQVGNQPPVYVATSSAALTGPALVPGTEPGEIVEVNPFQTLSSSLSTTTDILVSLMNSDPKRDQFAPEGVTDDYVVSVDTSVIYFDVTGADPAAVVATAARLVELADTEVAGLQSKPVGSPESRIRVVPLALPTFADEDTTAGLRLLALIAAVGLVAAAAGAVAFDGVAALRARRADEHRSDVIAATSWADPTHSFATGPAEARGPDGPDDGRRRRNGGRAAADEDSYGDSDDDRPADEPHRGLETVGRAEPDADTVVIDGPVTAQAARHGRPD